MPILAKVALVFVVFIDIIGQGLVFPIINTLVMDPAAGFMPQSASTAARQLTFGIVIGSFFIAWTIGAPYVSQLSDIIGRKRAMLICLFGAMFGYGLTIIALYVNSLPLLIVGRLITGFTAGNQPIAQAALVDASANAEERARNMGLIMIGTSMGLIGGPLLGGLLSSPALLGSVANFKLPFFAALFLVVVTTLMVALFFHDIKTGRGKYVFHPLEIVDIFAKLARYPTVMRLTAALFFFHIANVTFYIFVENYLTTRFGFGEVENSLVFATIGLAIILSSTYLIVPAHRRFSKRHIIVGTMVVWTLSVALFIASPIAWLCFVPVFTFYFVFGVAYPTMLAMFSHSVPDEEQGWVMGMSLVVFTAVGGILAVMGGWLSGLDLDLPFYIVIGSALSCILAIRFAWTTPKVREIADQRAPAPAAGT
ncbi:MAG: MFS transporter [Pseudomonadota bacterium]